MITVIACGPRRLHCREHSFPVKALGERRAARTVLQGPLVVVSGRFVRPICEPSRFFSAIPAVPSRRKTSQMIIRLSFKHCQLLCSRHLSACGRIPQLGGGLVAPLRGGNPRRGLNLVSLPRAYCVFSTKRTPTFLTQVFVTMRCAT